MKAELKHIHFSYTTRSGKEHQIPLSYRLFGKDLLSAPIVLVNHALTGNSEVAGERGWWKQLVGDRKTIDTLKYTVLCFDIPGNGHNGHVWETDGDFIPEDIAAVFLLGLERLGIRKLRLLIGGSLGGGIGWEMLARNPELADIFIPIACDYRTSDWLYAQCLVQKFLLDHREQPLQKARIHAMLCYRTPESINQRFKNRYDSEKKRLESEDWLIYHGDALNKRFTVQAYRLMNHLLMNINTDESRLKSITAAIHLVSVDTDLFFAASEIRACFRRMTEEKKDVFYHEIKSVHGHDAFLMEYEQLHTIIKDIL